MARFRYSYVISGGSAEVISDRIDRLASLGYDAVDAPVIIVAPTAFLRTQPITSESEEWDLAVERAGQHAASLGVDLTLECWNRYERYQATGMGNKQEPIN